MIIKLITEANSSIDFETEMKSAEGYKTLEQLCGNFYKIEMAYNETDESSKSINTNIFLSIKDENNIYMPKQISYSSEHDDWVYYLAVYADAQPIDSVKDYVDGANKTKSLLDNLSRFDIKTLYSVITK